MILTPFTFKYDHIARTKDGRPLARLIMPSDEFSVGENLKVTLLKIPKVFNLPLRGLELYIDNQLYRVPLDLPELKIRSRGSEDIISNFILPVYAK
jgi:hypothetical protein